ncbi:BREX-1 system adenine-specific DNA-methyltransferase PglX [Methylomonas albis]|uniref:site-specific DNA-methyltransferase (adenine-specific) n=1 Tax=Methylomonas albis TaxID=1854563 RepID=A0ABR9D514_9GAMM|nr:BREX-1 system adenine-specific DNA-methyltransferase PglX [Methylomonas albis]MBD9357294.1 BREX-1 system adenine-specific DNA-methyltransferase PglX [Methylomonas albis]
MNKAKLKTYAPQARKDFIAAVTARAHRLGLSEENGQLQVSPAEKSGDLVIIAGQSWPAKISRQRDNLIGLMQKHGFAQTVENVAYTWFNRFAALRYMEIHDYLNHGYRVLSSREGGLPEILSHAPELAQNGNLPGLNPQRAIELKLAGDQDGELYRLTLIAQCNALSNAMPFLFEKIDDETELLLPDNLLLTDSIIAKLVDSIPEEDWSQVEIIGWLYQFYISEKKAQVIGKVVKSEDIPAATQLFTPNWIVQYLVQNSIGRLWLMANPASTLKSEWPYYIEPAEQTPEVQAQLDALIQTRIAQDGGSLNPETLTVLDPACGSGHILVEAYEVLKAIYLERGYQPRSIPRLILEKNLYGLDIDDRAAQLAGFALLMKARADDRRLLDNPPKLNVLALQESKGLATDELVQALSGYAPLTRPNIASLLETFANARTFGSLIQISSELYVQFPAMQEALLQTIQSGDLFTQAAAFDLLPLVRQGMILGMQFDSVVANPPYMGGKGMNGALKEYAKHQFPDSKSDLFAMFIERGFKWCKPFGFNSMVTMQSWMFLSSYKEMREKLLLERTIQTMAHLGARAFGEISGEVVQTTAVVLHCRHFNNYRPVFFRLVDGQEAEKEAALRAGQNRFDESAQDDFNKIPGSPVAYWASDKVRSVFSTIPPLGQKIDSRQGMASSNDTRFVRYHWEIDNSIIGSNCATRSEAKLSGKKWFPYDKGGEYRKWFGNNLHVINWANDGQEVLAFAADLYGSPTRTIKNISYYFREGITWSAISSGKLSVRLTNSGHIFSNGGMKAFSDDRDRLLIGLGLLNSKITDCFISYLSETINYDAGLIARLPLVETTSITPLVDKLVIIAAEFWNYSEQSMEFQASPLIILGRCELTVNAAWLTWCRHVEKSIEKTKELEEQVNHFFIEAYGMQDELSPEIPEEQITIARADREKDCQRLISYAIGCMMGRYSLDNPGLIYAHAGNVGFDPNRYRSFSADADGIVPITDELWFEDDAANRIREFLLAVWGSETLDENLTWLVESLGQKTNETQEETIRRYLAGSFFKDHLQTYKKRPIYWLFSSGKQGAFQALVYLHRYHEGTLARMRAEYVVPLIGKIQSRIEMLKKDADAAASNAARSKLNKEKEKLEKKHVELLAYDEKLRHYADRRIQLDLDEGVKVNYGKFGDLMAEVKAITGGSDD